MSEQVYGGPEVQAYTAQREREFAEQKAKERKEKGSKKYYCEYCENNDAECRVFVKANKFDSGREKERHRIAIGARKCGYCSAIGHNRRKCPKLRGCEKVHPDGRVCCKLIGHDGKCASVEGKWMVSWRDPVNIDPGMFVGSGI